MAFANPTQIRSLTELYGRNSGQEPPHQSFPHEQAFVFDGPIPGLRTKEASSTQPTPDQIAIQRDISLLFSELRPFLGRSQQVLAKELGTDIHTLAALEAGYVDRLPQWPETERIVRSYLALVGVDAAPVLVALKGAMRDATSVVSPLPTQPLTLSDRLKGIHAAAFDPQAPSMIGNRINLSGADTPLASDSIEPLCDLPLVMVSNDNEAETVSFLGKSWHHMKTLSEVAEAKTKTASISIKLPRLRRLMWAGVCIVLLIMAGAMTPGWGALSRNAPTSVGQSMRQLQDFILLRLASEEDGMPLISGPDPRSRKDNKLPSDVQ
ncbi:MAG: helix-turn-helix domain-containing protein [Hyphomicrobiaceae bacterium]